MDIGYGAIKKEYVVDVLPETCNGNNILTGTGWMKKVEKCNSESTTMSVKLYIYGLLYHNITLKDVTKVDILNRIHSEQKNAKMLWQSYKEGHK